MTSADFAAAQQRISARRQQRLASEQSHALQRQQQLIASSRLATLPLPLRDFVVSFFTTCSSVVGRDGTKPTFRVGQVDAELLDEDLLALLKGQVGEALKYYSPHLRDDWDAEILLALRSVLFKLTIWDHNASYGAALQNLQYTDARNPSPTPTHPRRWQKALYGLFSVGGRYAWQKWQNHLLDVEAAYDYEPSSRLQLLSRLSTLASTTHSFAAFASFLVFLLNGKYRTILDRILRLRLMPTTNRVSREVSFEYLNRQLVWHAFTEFLLFLLPLVGISRWRRWLSRAWRRVKAILSFQTSKDNQNNEPLSKSGELGFLPERTCAICYKDQNPTSTSEAELAAMSASSGGGGIIGSAQTDVTSPYECIPCGCIYCFVCLAQRLEAEEGQGWICLRCGEIVYECKPWSGDVVLADKKPRKRVSFLDKDSQVHPETEEYIKAFGEESFQSIDPLSVDNEDANSLSSRSDRGFDQIISDGLDNEPLDESAEWARIDGDAEQEKDLASLAMLDHSSGDGLAEEADNNHPSTAVS